ncbi:MAG: HPr family phosphocarrier protein [Pseudomonadota bacterium]
MTCSANVEIVNRKGLHARASAKLANLALTLPAKITLSHEDETANARSIMDLLCLGAGKGDTVKLVVEGEDEQAALQAVLALIEDGFGELAEDAACCKSS